MAAAGSTTHHSAADAAPPPPSAGAENPLRLPGNSSSSDDRDCSPSTTTALLPRNVGRQAPSSSAEQREGRETAESVETDASPIVLPPSSAPPRPGGAAAANNPTAAVNAFGSPTQEKRRQMQQSSGGAGQAAWQREGARAVRQHIVTLSLPEAIADLIIGEGFDDIPRLALVLERDLEQMGIKRGYRRQILSSVSSLLPPAAKPAAGAAPPAAAAKKESAEDHARMDQHRNENFEHLKDKMRDAAALCNESPLEYEQNIVPRDEMLPGDVSDDLLVIPLTKTWERSEFSNQPRLDHEVMIPPTFSLLRRVLAEIQMTLFRIMFMGGVCLGHFGWQQFIYLILQLCWTYACMENTILHAQVNPSFFITITVFPLAFAVNSAYARREAALASLADMRACGIALFASHRSWRDGAQLPHHFVLEAGNKMRKLFHHMDYYLRFNHSEDQKVHHMMKVYDALDSLYDENEILRRQGFPPPLITRPIHELQQISSGFERLRIVADYRTPVAIRAYTYFSVLLLNTLLAPYFAGVSAGGTHRSLCFVYAGLFIAFLQLLLQVQHRLEEPFGNDFDDIRMGMPKAIEIAVAKQEKQVAMLACRGRASVSSSGAWFAGMGAGGGPGALGLVGGAAQASMGTARQPAQGQTQQWFDPHREQQHGYAPRGSEGADSNAAGAGVRVSGVQLIRRPSSREGSRQNDEAMDGVVPGGDSKGPPVPRRSFENSGGPKS